MSFKIVVYTAAANSQHVIRTVSAIARRHKDAEFLILSHQPKRSAKKLVKNQFRNLKRHGWRWIPYQATEILQKLGGKHSSGRQLSYPANATILAVASVNDPKAVALVKDWQPDLGLSLAAPIIRERQFALPRLGTINIHKGKLPSYRGMPPAFWEIWHGENEVGVTVHRVESGLDTGPILIERTVPIEHHATPAALRSRLDEVGIEMMAQAVDRLRDGTAEFHPQQGGGRTFTRPTLAQESQLAKRIQPPSAKRKIKNAVFTGYGIIGKFSPAYGKKTTVFLYHRVNDALRDSVTIGVEQFETHVRYLADHYKIVSMRDLVDGHAATDGPVVAISFDDGYLDNFENAAPILYKHNVPATFFISTNHITDNRPFAHDLTKLQRGLPNMNWDQVREMQAAGFEFGSHTADHIKLARTDTDDIVADLSLSKQAMHDELGLEDVMFAYPFGKREDITAAQVQVVKDLGFICNCSAYGGVNGSQVDRWDIRRQGIDHSFDAPALRAKLAGWKETAYV